MTFKKPVATPKVYTAVGSDGWLMTLPRAECDDALVGFLSKCHMPAKLAIDAFRNTPEFRNKADDWSAVLSHLARLSKEPPDSIPIEVALSLWCQAIEGVKR